jgi:N6-L-threonylcarbamoyladenine synthase
MMKGDNLDFSFSGLKTAVRLHVAGLEPLGRREVADVAASAQAAIVDVLLHKTITCALQYSVKNVYIAGGVAANGPLRSLMNAACRKNGIDYHAPLLEYCTDNGAMVARAGLRYLKTGSDDWRELDVFARGELSSRAA